MNDTHPTMARIFEKTGLDPTELALAINMSPQNITNWSKRGVSKTGAIAFSNKFKISLDWVLTGRGEADIEDEGSVSDFVKSTKTDFSKEQLYGRDYISIGGKSDYPLVPVEYLDIKASCGNGYVNEEYPSAHTQAFTVEFLRDNNLPINGEGLLLMHACSDSMGYTIPHGTLMLVNTNESEFDNFINNKIYVFQADSEMICKRAIKNLNGTVVLKSDNFDKDSYPDQTINRNTFSEFNLFGRVKYTFTQH